MDMMNEKNLLRELAKVKAEFASEAVNMERQQLWTDMNDLKTEKPAIYINEVPWHEMNVNDELTLVCEDPFHKQVEWELKKEIYAYKHFPGDQIVSNYVESPIVINDSGFGIQEESDIVRLDDETTAPSRHFHIQIKGMDDIEKIIDPVISIDEIATAKNFERRQELFDGILGVRKIAEKGMWFTPWDYLIRYTGVQEAMMDLILQPEYVDKLVERYVDASMSRMEQFKALGLWASNNNNTRVGSGGYGYTSELDEDIKHPLNAPTKQIWGCGNAQIFSDVSPQMHWDFSLKHELRWLENFGMNYYGCCEPLSGKFDILDKIPNLRKVSTSPWSDIAKSAERSKGKYVLSIKPNPAVFITDTLDEAFIKKDLKERFDQAKGCSFELVMKDISSVKYQPQRLWRWAEIAKETIEEYYG